ncbi:SgcJ/EcaC family oxidoreductase [Gracilibacillus phocaeensis]|uniref:SgcJ/EcaC family oxidoreductase n=1 Tax=Gracilibacillus phocaeensis TaxID=2042304 RepID=UPI00102F6D4F|nr:SgcJ/EcaC family oxidoreductase [Gracilibacillus phocaeensis]
MAMEIEQIYQKLITAWNNREAQGMADLFAERGVQIGFDGSKIIGPKNILTHLQPIFAQHPTAPFVTKIKEWRPLGKDSAILFAIAGMVPPGEEKLDPALNAHQTMVVSKQANDWKIELFQNTPAAYHGRPELVELMTEELREINA